MPNCSSVDPLVTAYVDGELPPADAQAVDAHLAACPPCRARIAAERAVKDLIHARLAALRAAAPAPLHARCALLASAKKGTGIFSGWRRRENIPVPIYTRLAPFALAATLVLIVGGAFLYRMTQISTHVMAAELTADHLKCVVMNSLLRTSQSPAVVQSSLGARFDWDAHLPERPEEAGLELVGARPCLYGEGTIAHIMYRHEGNTVSVFMLPRKQRPDERLGLLGHQAAIWSSGDRTFVVVARKSRQELDRIATFIREQLR
jgi:anti-sigma factor RsiW